MKVHRILFLLLIFFLPSQLGLHLWPSWALVFGIRVDYLSPTLYLIDLIALALIFAWRPKISFWIVSPFLVFVIINSLTWLIPLLSFYKWLKVCLYLLVGYFVVQNRRFVRRHIFIPLAGAVTMTVAIGLLQMLLGRNIGGPLYFLGERTFDLSTIGIALMHIGNITLLRPYATLPHPNAFAGFLLVSLLLFYWTKPRHRLLPYVVAIAVLGILISFSQAAWIALAVIFILAFFPIRALRHTIFIIFIASGIASLILPIFAQQMSVSSLTFPLSISERMLLAEQAGSVISQSPVFGVGLGAFIPAMHSSMRSVAPLFQPVHNLWLLVFAELGIVGVLGILIFASRIVTKSRPLQLSFAAIFITGFVDHYWLTLPQTLLLFLICCGLWYNKLK